MTSTLNRARPTVTLPPPPGRSHRRRRLPGNLVRAKGRRVRSISLAALTGLLATEVVLAVPYTVRAAQALAHPQLLWLVVALVAQLISMDSFARMQRRMLAAGGTKIRMREMLSMTYAANALSASLPAGAVLSTGYAYRRLRRWGASSASASFTLIASGALSTAAFAGLGLVALVVVGNDSGSPVMLAVPVVVAFLALLVGGQMKRHPDRVVAALEYVVASGFGLIRRDPQEARHRLARVLAEVNQLRPRRRDWLAGGTFAALNWVADLVCLGASCRTVGLPGLTISLILVAYLAGMSVSSLPLLPGGIGTVDAAIVMVLVDGGAPAAHAAAAVVLYRAISFLLVVAIGWIAWITSRRTEQRRQTGLFALPGEGVP